MVLGLSGSLDGHFGEGVKGPNIGLGTQGIRLKRPEKTSLVDAKGCNYYLNMHLHRQ